MKISWKGQDLGEYNGAPRIEECRLIKRELGLLPMDFGQALQDGDPDATSMLVSIMLNRNGDDTTWDSVTGEMGDFDVEYNAEEKAEMKKQEAANRKAEAEAEDEKTQGKGGSVTPISSKDGARKRTSATSTARSRNTGPASGSTTD
jgi:hypothetical protein